MTTNLIQDAPRFVARAIANGARLSVRTDLPTPERTIAGMKVEDYHANRKRPLCERLAELKPVGNFPQAILRAARLEAEISAIPVDAILSRSRLRVVDNWKAEHYRNKPESLGRFETAWRTLKIYLGDKGVDVPRKLTREHCLDYIRWRVPPDGATENEIEAFHAKNRERDIYAASRNTAILELKMLGTVMKEAVLRGMAQGNSARELGLSRDEPHSYDELTKEDLEAIEKGFDGEPMRVVLERSYLIARHHGVRLNETRVALSDVTLKTKNTSEITFLQKGRRKRTKPLHPKLFTMFKELRDSGAQFAFDPPVNFSGLWLKYLARIGVKTEENKKSFHSLRVTVQNKLRRANVNDEIRRRYLSHERAKDSHEIYSRIRVDEMRVCHQFL